MKQHITYKQYDEISDSAKLKLIDWVSKRTKATELVTTIPTDMSIAGMFEFLDENTNVSLWGADRKNEVHESFWQVGYGEYLYQEDELVDALWKAVKGVLETPK